MSGSLAPIPASGLLIQGDCREVLARLPDASVDSVVTDPPAGIEFMGQEWDSFKSKKRSRGWACGGGQGNEGFGGFATTLRPAFCSQTSEDRENFIAFMAEVFSSVLRVLKPGGHALVWALPRTSHWTATALENAGFEIRDIITHHFGTGFPKSKSMRDIGLPGFGTALKPASEHWILCRKPISEKNVAANVLAHGTGALNIGACLVPLNGAVIQTIQGGNHGYTPGQDGPGEYRGTQFVNAEGRWPANLVLTCICEEEHQEGCPVRALDEQSGPRNSGKFRRNNETGRTAISTTAHNARNPNRTESVCSYGYEGFASRFFYVAKPSRREKEAGLDALPEGVRTRVNPGGLEHDPKWAPVKARNTHPTVKPVQLMRYLIRLVTPPGGLVLDPFMGSGTTGVAALQEGMRFVGIEREEEYTCIAAARIAETWAKLPAP